MNLTFLLLFLLLDYYWISASIINMFIDLSNPTKYLLAALGIAPKESCCN